MTIGERIANLRKDAGYSQEYVAESLGVSRQAVSKWEKDLSSPDTENLIKLSELLNTSVQFLATGKDFYFPEVKPAPEKPKKKIKIKPLIVIIIGIITGILILTYICLGLFGSVDVDLAACSGGYRTFIVEKYSKELTYKFLDNIDSPRFVSAVPTNASISMNYHKQDLWLTFDIVCESEIGNEYIYRVTFYGKRIWYDTYKWETVAIIG